MKPKFVAYLAALALLVSLISVSAAGPATAASGVTRQIALAGTGSPSAGDFVPSDGSFDRATEFRAVESEASPAPFTGRIDRTLSTGGEGRGEDGQSGNGDNGNARVATSFEGLNHYQQRYARGGNQFSLEPPDQALCVGNGFVVEAVNDVMNVFNYAGASVLPDNTTTNVVAGFPRNVNHAVDLNSFYGYPPAVDRSTGSRGQFVTDPTCLYDAATQRFFLVVLTLEVVPRTGAFTTVNHLDLAVSNSSNPTGKWKIYRIDVTNDGTNAGGVNPCPCLGDYPHIGADANGIYITTNSYPWFSDGFDGAQIYAFSKAQLAAGASTVTMQHIDTFGAVKAPSDAGSTQPGFTVWPAQSPGTNSFELAARGTEYFLSSNAADEATHPVAGTGGTYTSNKIVVWALTNTSSLNSASPNLTLSNKLVKVGLYALPPKAKQPGSGTAPGTNTPQGYCLNDETTVTVFSLAPGCWRGLVSPAAHARGPEVVSKLDSNDTRMQQVMFANGKIFGALDTAVTIGRVNRAGVAWFIVDAEIENGSVSADIARRGTMGMAGADLTYPAIGVTSSGRGVMALTLSGESNFPSAAYASISEDSGVGNVQVIAPGAATDDGFSLYNAQSRSGVARPRWGDYGAAAVDGNSIWIASEYIAHACNYNDWLGPFKTGGTGDNLLGTCGGASHGPGTRTALANWSTRISKIIP